LKLARRARYILGLSGRRGDPRPASTGESVSGHSVGTGEPSEADAGPGALAALVPSRQFVRFLLVGVLNTAVGYALFAVFVLLGLHYGLAAALSTILGVLFNFQTIGRLVFERRDPSLIYRFATVYAVTYLLNVGILRALEGTRVHVLVVQAVLVLPVAVLAFVLHRRFVFRRAVEVP
jgi:putative flippase GtrA